MFRIPSIIILIIVLILSFTSCIKKKPATAAATKIALVNGILIDGTGAAPENNVTILIDNGIIAAIGTNSVVGIPAETKVIDVEGAALVPGFINAHIHSGYNKFNLKTWASNGVTTVRDMGADIKNNLFEFRDIVNKDPQYARLVAAGPMVTVPGGYPAVPWNSPAGYPVTSPQDARRKINKLLDDGADIIKIAMESGKSFGVTIPMLSVEEAAAIVREAHERGTIVTAHVLTSNDLAKALDAGVDDIAHMVSDFLPDSLIKRMVENNIYWVPTLELWKCVGYNLDQVAVDNLRKFVQAGGKVALGTDYDGYNCKFDLGMPITEIELMQKAGMTPLQIIVAATKHAAHVCYLEKELGTIEVGKIADIIVLENNPLEDLHHLQNLRMVIHKGKVIRGE